MNQPAKRGRGRPKGSRNKSKIISGATVEDYCKIHNHNPTEFLICVARGDSVSGFDPSPDDQFRANIKLHDSIHHNKPAGSLAIDGAIDGQYEIVFVESADGFTLPGTTDAEGDPGTVQSKPLQCISDTPQSWKDSVCDQQADT